MTRTSTTPANILVIMADQLSPQFCGTYGHPLVKTPHMDELASRGMRFDAAYCNSPLCAPSRFSFMSGQLVSRIAGYDNGAEFKASIPTFAHGLRQLGYRTCLSGKMHFVGPDQLHGFEERLTTDIYPADHAWTPDWEAADERIDKWYHNMDTVREAGVAMTTFQIEYDEETAFFARRRLLEYAINNTQPFAMVASFIHPHDPYVARPEWWDLYNHDAIDLPQIPLTEDPHTRRLRVGIKADTDEVTEAQIRNARHAYYANVSYFDSKVGELIRTLKEAELYDNTLIVVTADHGDMLGERGLWYKMNFFEHSARVPMIISGPGVQQGTSAEPVSLVDLFPTFIAPENTAASGTPAVDYTLDGQSLWPLLQGQQPESFNGEVYGEYCAECASHPILMIRRNQYKYIHCDADPAQLFDIDTDPAELNNLAGDPRYTDIESEFAAEVAARWNSEQIRRDVLATQKQRQAVHLAMQEGALTSWDYQPKRDASQEFVRNHFDWIELAEKARFPRV
ncbi:choline-sulfatase [Chromatiales bacterium (ex Bugula neritina AB1)]|nr:choline-sulfatase [Chromatiales bacterium (ex Bugula neritina AB1)]